MAASSKPTDESSHPSGPLACDPLPNYQDFFYDDNLMSRRYALVGVACSIIFSCSCIVAGIVILANHGVLGVAAANPESVSPKIFNLKEIVTLKEILALTLNFIVTLCTESIGSVHGTALRSVLASESRLCFNTNLRLLTAARGWYNPNGTLLNCISAVFLIISYNSASLIVSVDLQMRPDSDEEGIAVAGLPLLFLGVALLLQVMIALSGMRVVKILTWSSSPFDLTAALIHHMQLTPATYRCMRCVSDLDTDGGPAKPSEIQPSAWHAHPSVRKVVISLWVIVAACAVWAALVRYTWSKDICKGFMHLNVVTTQMWSLLPDGLSIFVKYSTNPDKSIGAWMLFFISITVVQGPLTLGLHCSELIVNVIRDERQWRCATGKKGLRMVMNPVKRIFTHPICLVLFAAKPFLHWMFGLSFIIYHPASEGILLYPEVVMFTVQIWNLCIALFIYACFFTFVALRRPRGPQPAAYGHIQTLANLVDEWSPVMWWGHKVDGIPYCHAGRVLLCSRFYCFDTYKGTSDHPLPDVKMDCVYAGSGTGYTFKGNFMVSL
ncbi:hypothetical protein BDR03DRAFT_988145 [Suillus americanus]|nr:hypothetical protein BDR03DRAFT_988145 [Suillus americanus]